MEYKYLAEFARNATVSGHFYRKVVRWRDQYALLLSRDRYLQISLLQQDPFCFFTDNELISWGEAPELAMMHQHLNRARLEMITIADNDRIIYLHFSKPDPFKQRQNYLLILELIPQFGNIILTKEEQGKQIIIDCSRKVSFAENHQRQILPAVEYEPPPAGYQNDSSEVSYPLDFDHNMHVVRADKGYIDCNSLLESVYYKGWLKKLSDQNLKRQKRTLQQQLKKKKAKLIKLTDELANAQKENKWLEMGELLKSQQHLIKPGDKCIRVINYYQEQMPEIEITLDPEKSAVWNINNYFKKYRKSKTGKEKIREQIAITEQEMNKLNYNLREMEDVDMLLPGQILQQVTGKTPDTEAISRIQINENWEFLIGRNSKENDLITTRMAKPQDWWFHTRIFKGTHIVLRNYKKQELPPELMEIGCRLAAYYSKAGKSENVPVDYTQIRYVRKPRGSAAGYVIYTHQKTMYVNPLSIRQAREIVNQWKINSH